MIITDDHRGMPWMGKAPHGHSSDAPYWYVTSFPVGGDSTIPGLVRSFFIVLFRVKIVNG